MGDELKCHWSTEYTELISGFSVSVAIISINEPQLISFWSPAFLLSIPPGKFPRSQFLYSKALGEFENPLSGNKFFRIHHHYLINLNQVKEFQRHDGGYVIMDNNKEREVSQGSRKDFLDAIQDSVVW